MKDMTEKRRQPWGERAGHAKLTNEQADTIRKRLAAGATGKLLSREFLVSRSAISDVRIGKTFRHTQERAKPVQSPVGEGNPGAVITEARAQEIKNRLKLGASVSKLAEEMGLNYHLIYFIKAGRTWKHLK